MKEELKLNKTQLEALSGKRLRYFAYPFGGENAFNYSTAKLVKEAGFEGALTLVSGTVNSRFDQFQIPRIPISPKVSIDEFKARVLGAPLFSSLDNARRRLRSPRYG